MVVAGAPLWLVGIGGLFVAGWSQWRVSRLLIGSGEFGTTLQPSDWRDLDPKLGIAAKRYLLFSANEVLLYNLPLVVFTATSANNEIIYFGIWLRLYQLLVLPMRMIVDARINRQVTAYFQRRPDKVRKELNVSLLAASGFMTLSLATVFVCKRSILGWIGAAPMASDCWLIASLGIWGVGNTIQHVFGSFTLSYGGGFGFALRTSIVTLVTMCLVFAVELTLLAKIGPILFSLGVVYAVLSLFYGKHVGRILRKIPHTDS